MSSAAIAQASERVLTLLKAPIVPDIGIHPRIAFDTYHSWEAASNSRLTVLRRSPAHLKAYLEEPTDSAALVLGRICHTAILEPDEFAKRYLVSDRCEAVKKTDGKRCTNNGTVYNGGLGWLCGVHGGGAQSDPGITVVSKYDYEVATKMRDAVSKHRAAALLKEGMRELSLVWDDAESGVRCKARLDHHSPVLAGGAIVDIKTTEDASPRAFERSIYTYGYHRQGALYTEGATALGLGAEHFAILAIEKKPPYALMIHRVTEGALDAGSEQLRPALARYAECMAKDEWPGYPEDVNDIALPDYAWGQISEETKS